VNIIYDDIETVRYVKPVSLGLNKIFRYIYRGADKSLTQHDLKIN